jgi:hypothetical protein
LQRVEIDLLLVLANHGQKLPVGVPGVHHLHGLLALQDFGLLGAPFLAVLPQPLDLLDDVGPPASCGCSSFYLSTGSNTAGWKVF